MHVVWRDDRDGLDPVWAHGLAFGHFSEAGIAAIRGDPEFGGRLQSLVRRGRQRSGNKLEFSVEACRVPVDRADERSVSAADHSKSDRVPV